MGRTKGATNKSAREHAQDAVISMLKSAIKALREEIKALRLENKQLKMGIGKK